VSPSKKRPRLRTVPVTGKADLESDGSNLAVVLGNILRFEEEGARFKLLVRDLLPFVTDVKVDRFAAGKSLLMSMRERFSEDYLPASLLSDGTIHLTALVLALYFDKAPIVIIEEPERNCHPHLISKVAAMLADASKQKQVIVTTHNPELVKHARLEDLLLVHRDAEGFSQISRPAENEQLKVFLSNDLGVEDLYVQDLLGVGG
jgi:predicted ATPase